MYDGHAPARIARSDCGDTARACQQQCQRVVGDVVDAVVGHVDDLDSVLPCSDDVDVVVTRATAREDAYSVEPLDRFSREPRVVDEDRVDDPSRVQDVARIVSRKLS